MQRASEWIRLVLECVIIVIPEQLDNNHAIRLSIKGCREAGANPRPEIYRRAEAETFTPRGDLM